MENAGKISHDEATTKALLEYERYKQKTKDDLSAAEQDFLESIKAAQKKLEGKAKASDS